MSPADNPLPRTRRPLLARIDAPVKTLAIAIAVMCFLATLALAGLLMVDRTVTRWSDGVAAQVSVQIMPRANASLDDDVAAVVALLKATAGVISVRALSKDEGRRLLEPWLGKVRGLEDLPVPRLVALTIDTDNPPDLDALDKKIAAAVPGAGVDDHGRWRDSLTAGGRALGLMALAILAFIVIGAAGLVIYASRAAIESAREVIEILYLAGARDAFIARQVQSQFVFTALKSSLSGTAGAIVLMAVVAYLGAGFTGAGNGITATMRAFLDGSDGRAIFNWGWLAAVPVTATLLTLTAAHVAVIAMLRKLFR